MPCGDNMWQVFMYEKFITPVKVCVWAYFVKGKWILDPICYSLPSGVIKWVCLPIHTLTNTWRRLNGYLQLLSRQPNLYFILCGLMADMVICKHGIEYGHKLHRMSLMRPGVNKQHIKKIIIKSVTISIICVYRMKSERCPCVCWGRSYDVSLNVLGTMLNLQYWRL